MKITIDGRLDAFAADRLNFQPNACARSVDIRNAYDAWASERGYSQTARTLTEKGVRVITWASFGIWLRALLVEHGCDSHRAQSGTVWYGVRVLKDGEE